MAATGEACTLHRLAANAAAGDVAFNLSQLFAQHGDSLTVGRRNAAVLLRPPPAGGAGSAAASDLFRHISRAHAAFGLQRGNGGTVLALTVSDAASLHGTFLRGKRLPAWQPAQLADGDVVSFADGPVVTIAQASDEVKVRINICCYAL